MGPQLVAEDCVAAEDEEAGGGGPGGKNSVSESPRSRHTVVEGTSETPK